MEQGSIIRPRCHAFTLIELLSTIAILAVIVGVAVVFVANYVATSKRIADQQVLQALNQAVTRYKTQGGGTAGFTSGAPIRNVLARLGQTLTWGNTTHAVLGRGVTYPARSLEAKGTGAQYRFTKYNNYTEETGGTSPTGTTYTYGEGVGYADSTSNNYYITVTTTTGYFAVKPSNGAAVAYPNGYTSVSGAPSITFWSCAGAGDTTASGTVTVIDVADLGNDITILDVTGLTGLTYLSCYEVGLTTLNISGLSALETLYADTNNLTSLDISGLSAIRELHVNGSSIASLDPSTLPTLEGLSVGGNPLTSLNLSGLSNLTYLSCSSVPISSLDLSGLTALEYLYCSDSGITSINLSGLTSLIELGVGNLSLTSLDVTGLPLLNYIYAEQNLMNASALNALYTSLNSTAGSKNLFVAGNPGLSGDNPTIATAKGWGVF